jgi:predicted ATP-binding protein involved in virulence
VQDLFPNAQIFISTHSPFVVGSVDGARVYKFKLDENNNSVLDNEYLTEDGNSYDRILEEIFDIKERFGMEIQKQLEEFKAYKNKILLSETVSTKKPYHC